MLLLLFFPNSVKSTFASGNGGIADSSIIRLTFSWSILNSFASFVAVHPKLFP